MHLTAHAKVNWALSVLSRHEDGYHALDMVMQSVALGDTLEIEPADTLSLRLSGGHFVPGNEKNLALKAASLLKEAYGVSQGAQIRLKKRIPVGAGLGGGSADAAAALLGLSRLWGLRPTGEELSALALQVGADVPFCLTGGLARVRGIGGKVDPFDGAASFDLVIVQPTGGLSTACVFSAYDALAEKPKNPPVERALKALLSGDASALANSMGNALHAAAIPLKPEIAVCAQALEHFGALRAQMTGSGSAVIGLFDSPGAASRAARACSRIWHKSYHTRTISCGVSLVFDRM